MKKIKFFPIILLLALLAGLLPAAAVPAAAVDAPGVSAPTALVLDALTGAALYEKNADARVYPASTTKIMTALLAVEAIENGDARAEESVAAPAAAMEGLVEDGSTAGIRVGEALTMRQLLDCLMLSSANEAANILAIRLAGSVDAFAERMNARAAALGCTGTHFVNPHGLPDERHYTSAADMGRIAVEALRHPLFAELCATARREIPATNLSEARSLHNSNALLCRDGIYGGNYLYAGANGVKTGHTTAAGYCLVSSAERAGARPLALVFGCESADACFRDSAALLDWVFSNYSLYEVVKKTETVRTVRVRGEGSLDDLELRPVEDLSLLLPRELDPETLRREVTVYGADAQGVLTAPLPSGVPLGRLELLKDGDSFGGVDLVPAAVSAIVMDRRSGQILYGKAPDVRVYPADATKLMTALLAVEAVERGAASMNDMVTVTAAIDLDTDESGTRCGLQVGEQITLQALLSCVLLASADDAANAVAEFIGGTVPDFVAMMNARAAELGCRDTAFDNAHGAYSPDHYTTARDFCRIALEATAHEKLMRICGTTVAELEATNLSPARTLKNTNALLCDESVYGADYVYEGADGLKTGWNPDAGYVLAASASKNGIDLLTVVFGGVKDEEGYSCFRDTTRLFDWVFDNYGYYEVLKSTENIASVDIALGKDSDYVNIRPATSITVLLPNDYDPAAFRKDIRVYALENGETVTAPVTAGQVLGEVTVTRDGQSYGTVKLVASSTVELSRAQYIRRQVAATTHQRNFRLTVGVLAGLFVLYLIWVLVYRIKHIRHKRAVRAAERARALEREASMKPAPEPSAPGVRFFGEDDVSTALPPYQRPQRRPAPEPEKAREAAPEKPHEPPPDNLVELFRVKKDTPVAQTENILRGNTPIVLHRPDPADGELFADTPPASAAPPAAEKDETESPAAEKDAATPSTLTLFPGAAAPVEDPAITDIPAESGSQAPDAPPAASKTAETGAQAPITSPAASKTAASKDLLADALLVAELEPPREETPEEKAERDYFAEFFRPKK